MFRNRSASLWVERYFGVADMCRTGPYAWVPVASRPGFWYAVRYFGVADMCRTGPYAWVPGASRPGFWYALATRVPQQIRNSLGGAVKGTRFADIPLDTCSAISAAPGKPGFWLTRCLFFGQGCSARLLAGPVCPSFTPRSWRSPITPPPPPAVRPSRGYKGTPK